MVDSNNETNTKVISLLKSKKQNKWIESFEKSIGINNHLLSLEEQVISCLDLFIETYQILEDIVSNTNKSILENTISLIKKYTH